MKRLVVLILLFVSLPAAAYAKKTLRIESEPAGARVEINGEFIGSTPWHASRSKTINAILERD